MDERPLRLNRSRAFGRATHIACNVRWHAVTIVIVGARGRRGRSRRKRFRFEAGEHARDHIPGSAGAGTVSQHRRP